MYRNCIFCSAHLGRNESLEQFPVGRRLAFDGAKGRLWAVCPRCARWNLAPLAERWEVIEAGERLFRDCRLRAQSENVGMAKLRDGTRLIRIGRAHAGELAAWRYGKQIARRQPAFPRLRRTLESVENTIASPMVIYGSMLLGVPAMVFGAWMVARGVPAAFLYWRNERRVVHVLGASAAVGAGAQVRREDLDAARISLPDDGRGLQLMLPYGALMREQWGRYSALLRGDEARSALARLMVHVNEKGAAPATIADSVALIGDAGSPDQLVNRVARQGHVLANTRRQGVDGSVMPLPVALALEMALHEETERRAMEGELKMLEAMWREAEEIADIADRLPDGVRASQAAQI